MTSDERDRLLERLAIVESALREEARGRRRAEWAVDVMRARVASTDELVAALLEPTATDARAAA